jgi:hypothetical protein
VILKLTHKLNQVENENDSLRTEVVRLRELLNSRR